MKITKKLFAFLLTFLLIIGIIPLAAFTTKADTVKLGYIFETGVNIRAEATTNSAVVDNVSKWNVTVLDTKNDTAGTKNPETGKTFVWYKITYSATSGTITGYVREDLIKVTEYTPDEAFKKSLESFPESYRDALTKLHAVYPNWQFEADTVGYSFTKAVAAQDTEYTKLVETEYNSWRSMRNKCYNWSKDKFITTDGGRYGASTEVISYYMDPRNFLNANDIYIYMKQSYDSKTQTSSAIQKILDGTFLKGKVTDKNDEYYGKTYASVIRYAGKQSGVNALVLASTIIQEHGTKGTTLSNGTTYKKKKVYNFFNFGASGTTSSDIVTNGSKYAYDEGWFTPTESIVGGAKKYGKNYISIGQDTYFYKNYNILNPDKIWHQYAQNVADSLSSARKIKNTYAELKDMKLTFRIPVYTSLPSKVSKLPTKSNKLNNYYFENIKVDGLSPSYNKYTTSYKLNVSGDTQIVYKLPKGATYTGNTIYSLKAGKNTVNLKIKSETGYSRTYTITVTAEKDATLTVNSNTATLKKEADGKWYYYVDGVKSTDTTLVKYSDTWFYVKDGVWDKTANMLFEYSGQLLYIKNGKWAEKTTTLFKHNNKWLYINKGKWNGSATTLVKYSNTLFYVKNGVWDKSATTLVKYSGKWYYVKRGKWSDKANTLVKYSGKWYYVKGGIWQKTTTTLVKYSGKWYYVKRGKWVKDTLIFTYKSKRFYVKRGKVDLTFSGWVKVNGKTYRIKKGKVV